MSKNRKTTRLSVETLESRQLMAGNVLAMNNNGLTLIGDNQANSVSIQQVFSGYYRVTGNNTTINGKPFFDIYAPNSKMEAYMGGGNDSLSIQGNSQSNVQFDSMYIDMGQGADWTLIDQVFTKYDSTIRSGYSWDNDVDNVIVNRMSSWSGLSINTGAGSDQAWVQNSWLGGALRVDTGSGSDILNLENSAVDSIFADMGTEDDMLTRRNTRTRVTDIDMGQGIDKIVTDTRLSFGSISIPYQSARNNESTRGW
jgi:hypothetical protein